MTEQNWQGDAPPTTTTPPGAEPSSPTSATAAQPPAETTGPTVDELQARIAELEAEKAAAVQPVAPAPADQTKPVDATTSQPAPQPSEPAPLAAPAPVDVAAQQTAEHAIAPGSAGLAVRELAQLLETLGHETYITRGENYANVFTDELMAAVKRELTEHHKETAETTELPQLLRDVALIEEVSGETWRMLRDRAAKAIEAATA